MKNHTINIKTKSNNNSSKNIDHNPIKDKKDTLDLPEPLEHGICVSNLAYLISKDMDLPEDFCQQMAMAGMVHDIGKIRLFGYLYGDDSTLTVEKLRYIRMHSKLGYDILCNEGFNDTILKAVLYHHENYDGSGYPENLVGENIPLGARILRVCDVFAALISNRTYRKAFDVETAVELMIDEVKNFDMKIFLSFMSVIHNVNINQITRKEDER